MLSYRSADGTLVEVPDVVVRQLSVEWGGLEEGWLLLGERKPDRITIVAAVSHGPRSTQTPSGIDFDREDMVERVFALRRMYGDHLVPVGLAHTHPPVAPCPSANDLRSDLQWIKGSPHPWLFCIVCNRPAWWLLRDGWTDYEELKRAE